LIRGADAAYVNFEMLTPSFPAVPGPVPIALRVAMSDWTLDELAWLGFGLFGFANNHANDYGLQGLLETIEQMEARALTFAGSGRNLEEARLPAYHDVPGGRIALICATSSGAAQSLASDGKGVIGSRVGTNPLRFDTEYQLEPGMFEQLRRIDEELGSAEMTRRLLALGVFPGFDGRDHDVYRFCGRRFVRSARTHVSTRPHRQDVTDICRQIYEARRSADLVVVGLHSHEGAADGWNVEEPAEFIGEAAHAFVDAGADVVFGHGPHQLRGVEMYHDRPIFYSLGNFLFLDETISVIDPPQYAMFGLDEQSTPADLHDWREKWPDGSARGFHSRSAYWESVIARCRFDGSSCTSVDLVPVELSRTAPRLVRGLPRRATGEEAERILSEVARMSEPYGTAIKMLPGDGGCIGHVEISPSGS
jgi:poly-gamma-glutamate synthesis protein (capsule biosynthesis protein)